MTQGTIDKERQMTLYLAKKAGAIGLAMITGYLAYANHTPLKRLEDSLLLRNVPLSTYAFPDPAGVDAQTRVSDEGTKDLYLIHNERMIRLYADLLPETDYILRHLKKRTVWMDEEESKRTLDALIGLQRDLSASLKPAGDR